MSSVAPKRVDLPQAGGPAPAEAGKARRHSGTAPETKTDKKRIEQSRVPAKTRADAGIAEIPAARRDEEQDDERFPPSRRGDLQQASDKGDRRRPKKGKGAKSPVPVPVPRHGFARPTAPVVREVVIPETISIADLAQKMSVKATGSKRPRSSRRF